MRENVRGRAAAAGACHRNRRLGRRRCLHASEEVAISCGNVIQGELDEAGAAVTIPCAVWAWRKVHDPRAEVPLSPLDVALKGDIRAWIVPQEQRHRRVEVVGHVRPERAHHRRDARARGPTPLSPRVSLVYMSPL